MGSIRSPSSSSCRFSSRPGLNRDAGGKVGRVFGGVEGSGGGGESNRAPAHRGIREVVKPEMPI